MSCFSAPSTFSEDLTAFSETSRLASAIIQTASATAPATRRVTPKNTRTRSLRVVIDDRRLAPGPSARPMSTNANPDHFAKEIRGKGSQPTLKEEKTAACIER